QCRSSIALAMGSGTYRSAMIIIGLIPILVSYTTIPTFHLLYAVLLGFANVGANFYASFSLE
ncbi:hypothetical protein, partial [Klebsiella aerogenes]|uniref:hypothetical protein n=1 Tax=Klebsiella aerogenes TaxID=548 RepID=UPI00195310E8